MASLFDTGACERLRRGERATEQMAVRLHPPIICIHVAAELLYGWRWTRVGAEELRVGHEFIESLEILVPGLVTATIYARLRVDARRIGKQLPDADFWIAAHAIEHRLPLILMDHHFTLFDDLKLHLLS